MVETKLSYERAIKVRANTFAFYSMAFYSVYKISFRVGDANTLTDISCFRNFLNFVTEEMVEPHK